MNFTTKDTKEIKIAYQDFLKNLKTFIIRSHIYDIKKQFALIRYLLENAYFTSELEMILDDKYNYLSLPNELEDGIQIMYGICCCRHANVLLNNILQLLEYNSALLFIFIDKDNIWHRKKNGCEANHIVTTIQQQKKELILDLANNYIFEVDTLGNIILLNEELTRKEKEICQQYTDETYIKKISKILKKYYSLKNLGVKNIYDDEEYG